MRILVAVPLLFALSSLGAQAPEGPRAGSWGAEASTASSASLLRFRSFTSAWITGVSLSAFREDVSPEPAPPAASDDRTVVFFDYRIGIRRYSKNASRVRRFSTLSALISFADLEFQNGWTYGLAGDVGAAYFFTPHVSLGASAELTARYGEIHRDFGAVAQQDVRTYSVSFAGFRLLGAVYF